MKIPRNKLNPQNGNLNAIFLRKKCGKALECFFGTVVHRHNTAQLDVRVEAHKDSRQANKRVHRCDKLWHLRHLHFGCQLIADNARPPRSDQATKANRPSPGPISVAATQPKPCPQCHTKPHASHFPAPTRPPSERMNKNCGNYVSRCCETIIH